MIIGPRTISYRDINGEEGFIKIEIELDPPVDVKLEDGGFASDHSGSVIIKSDLIDRRIKFVGVDDCQVLFRAMWISDIAIQKLAKDLRLQIWALEEGDISADFDVFKA